MIVSPLPQERPMQRLGDHWLIDSPCARKIIGACPSGGPEEEAEIMQRLKRAAELCNELYGEESHDSQR